MVGVTSTPADHQPDDQDHQASSARTTANRWCPTSCGRKPPPCLALQGCSGPANLHVRARAPSATRSSAAGRAHPSCGMSFSPPTPTSKIGRDKEEPAYTRELKRHGGSGRRSALTCTRRRSLTCRSLTVSNARPLQSQWRCVSRLCLPDGFSQSLDHLGRSSAIALRCNRRPHQGLDLRSCSAHSSRPSCSGRRSQSVPICSHSRKRRGTSSTIPRMPMFALELSVCEDEVMSLHTAVRET